MIKKLIASALTLYLVSLQVIVARPDSIPLKNLEIDLVFSLDRITSSDDRTVHEPEFLVEQRITQSPYAAENPTYVNYTDNPFFHFSAFMGLQMNYHLNESFFVHADLFAEHRGYSLGFLSDDIVRLFPQFFVGGKDTLTVFDQTIQVEAKIGDLIHHTVNHGLTFSNDDYQGGSLWLKWRKLFFRYTVLADASANAGLNVDELWSYKLGYESRFFENEKRIALSTLMDQIIIVGLTDDPVRHYGLCLDLFLKRWRFFGETSLRSNNVLNTSINEVSGRERLAFLIGMARKWEWERNEAVNINLSLRRYAKHFNDNYSGEGRSTFRNTDEPFYGNYSGNQFYPLKNTYRPFLKWPIFTQYQGMELWSASLQLSFQKRVWKDFFFNGKLEVLHLDAEEAGAFYYHFYHTGISYNGWKEFQLELYLTNQVMNLDVGFQSFYQTNTPLIGYRCIRWFGEGPDPTKKQRLY